MRMGLGGCILHSGVVEPCLGLQHGSSAPKSGTRADCDSVNLGAMEQTSLLQPMMAGRGVGREPGADGTGAG